VRIDGQVRGRVTSGGFGYTVGRSIAFAYLPVDMSPLGMPVFVNVFGEWVPGVVAAAPLHDPKNTKVHSDS
jgi:glycine cleavage system aminomethyltransferase T